MPTRPCMKCWRYQPEYKFVLDLEKPAVLLLRKQTESIPIAWAENNLRDGSNRSCICGNGHANLTHPLKEEVRRAAGLPCVSFRTSWFCSLFTLEAKKKKNTEWHVKERNQKPRMQNRMFVPHSSSHLTPLKTHHFTVQVKPHLTAVFFLGGWSLRVWLLSQDCI